MGLLVIPCIANALSPKDDDLLLYLPFNEGKGNTVQDLSKNGNDGEIVGTVKWVDGEYGTALEFSEADEVKAPYIPLNNKSYRMFVD